jgi:hypothetical protein
MKRQDAKNPKNDKPSGKFPYFLYIRYEQEKGNKVYLIGIKRIL